VSTNQGAAADTEGASRWSAVAALAVVVGVVGVAGYAAGGRLAPTDQFVAVPVDPGGAAPDTGTVTVPRALTVHVSGAVVRPGLVEVPDGARVADAILAAGGATPEADLAALNLAEPLADALHLRVPAMGDPRGATGGGVGAPADGKVRVNVATRTELETLPGIGPVLAQRIVDHREAAGPFATVEDLLDIPGIGERVLANLRDSVVVP
jgi:competence protein ComEA